MTNAELAQVSSKTKDFHKLGRLTGYDATYTALAVSGLTEVDAFASIYTTSTDAHNSLMLTVAEAQNADRATVEPPLARAIPGNEALVYLTTSRSGSMKVHRYHRGLVPRYGLRRGDRRRPRRNGRPGRRAGDREEAGRTDREGFSRLTRRSWPSRPPRAVATSLSG